MRQGARMYLGRLCVQARKHPLQRRKGKDHPSTSAQWTRQSGQPHRSQRVQRFPDKGSGFPSQDHVVVLEDRVKALPRGRKTLRPQSSLLAWNRPLSCKRPPDHVGENEFHYVALWGRVVLEEASWLVPWHAGWPDAARGHAWCLRRVQGVEPFAGWWCLQQGLRWQVDEGPCKTLRSGQGTPGPHNVHEQHAVWGMLGPCEPLGSPAHVVGPPAVLLVDIFRKGCIASGESLCVGICLRGWTQGCCGMSCRHPWDLSLSI